MRPAQHRPLPYQSPHRRRRVAVLDVIIGSFAVGFAVLVILAGLVMFLRIILTGPQGESLVAIIMGVTLLLVGSAFGYAGIVIINRGIRGS